MSPPTPHGRRATPSLTPRLRGDTGLRSLTARARWTAAAFAGLGSFAVAASTSSAHASGNAVARFGGEHGTVNTTNPTALYFNPGAIGFSTRSQLFIDGQLALRSLQWTHSPGQGDVMPPASFEGANFGTARALNLFGAPMLGATWHLGRLVLGAAAYAPFGGSVEFEHDPNFASRKYPGAQAGVARWHGIEAATKSIYGTLGAAYRIGPVSVGITGNIIYTTLALTRAQSVTGTNDIASEGRSSLEVTGLHGSFALGVLAEVVRDRLWLAASYQAQPGLGVQELDGSLKVTGTAHANAEALTRDVTFHQALPDIWRMGLRFRPKPTQELRLAADFTRWSVQQTQCISVRDLPCVVTAEGDVAPDSGVVQNVRRYWRDTVGLRAGASVWITPEFELFGGVGYESGAAPDRTLEPVLADANNVALAIGGRFEIAPSWYLSASYTQLLFITRYTTGVSQLANPATGAVTRQSDAGGLYRQWVGILDANVTKTF